MKQNRQLVILVWLGLTICFGVDADPTTDERRTYTKIYEKINGAVACFRRFNGTHQIGCSSKSLNGDTGVLHVVNDEESLDWVLKDGPHSPYIVVMGPKTFFAEYMKKFQSNKRVAGVLLLDGSVFNETKKVEHFSSDSQCPNQGFGFFNKTSTDKQFCPKWNKEGSGMLWESWDFPVFFVHNKTEAEFILKCYQDFNEPIDGGSIEWPLCAAQLQSFMLGAVDTPTCMRRNSVVSITPSNSKVCDPLANYNIHAPLTAVNQTTPYRNNSVIVIGARLDAASMFDNIAPGADTAATGIATLFAVLKHLSTVKEQLLESTTVDNIYFILFQGEAFDYIGSSRLVYDMANGKFPYSIDENSTTDAAILRLEHIKYFIDIGQVALKDSENTYHMHQNYYTNDSSAKETKILTDMFAELGKSVNLNFNVVEQNGMGLPPASLQSFLKVNPDIPGIVITNHAKEFKNPFYNSILDTDENMEYVYEDSKTTSIQNRISSLAATIANTVWKVAGLSSTPQTFQPDMETVDELLNCYIATDKCKIFEDVNWKNMKPPPQNASTYQLYVGVRHQHYELAILTKNIMVCYQGTTVNKTEDECKADKGTALIDIQWLNGTCYETTVNISDALSPAFILDNYDWKSGQYPTWTESIWQTLQVRIFLKPSLQHELLTLCFGLAIFIVSFVIVGWANRKSDVIFSSSSSAEAIIC